MQRAKQKHRLDAIRVISFDAAGTLIAPAPSVGSVYAEIMTQHGLTAEPADLETNFKYVFGPWRKDHPNSVLNKSTWREIVWRTLGTLCPQSQFDAVFEDLWDTFAEGRRWRILPGANECLERLKANGYRLAVLSNNDERLHRVLKELGLSRHLEAILASTEIGVEKPAVEAFRAMEAMLDCPPEAILHVGDRVDEDVQGALNASWQAVWLGPQENAPPNAFTIDCLSELCDLVGLPR